MSFITELFVQLKEELRVFSRNLCKDSHVRRTDIRKITGKREKLSKLTVEFEELRKKFNKETHDPEIVAKAKAYVCSISKLIEEIDSILKDRLANIRLENTSAKNSVKVLSYMIQC